jgi:PIN domain nuclease of toxin-antitoxin system
MKLLLDTYIFLWWINGDARLSPNIRAALREPGNERYFSSVSVAEMAVKSSLGKLKLADTIENTVRNGMMRLVAAELPLHIRHSLRLSALPLHHRDPFDRLLVVQAMEEGMTLVTEDLQIKQYAVTTIS